MEYPHLKELRPLTERLDGIFERYVTRADEIARERWQKRGLGHKLKTRRPLS
jgi:hypothetical protein